ncbi:unnamed protein product [Symbiodinium sp. CCMP2592]|nr:unnamed protein product [Symbiodinium sp. CCMP2592]CAE7344282.1 unnamed protein product [Symbiodinium sp. CCMP2592]CAE7828600.1 unnamed protein product [Symbiodinium sp. CCMP2592]
MPLFRAAQRAAECDRVRLFYSKGQYMDNMTLNHAFTLQANSKTASTLLGENERKQYRRVTSPGPSEEATTVRWEPPAARQEPTKSATQLQGTPDAKGKHAELSPPAVTPAKSTCSSLPATQPRSPWVEKLRLRKALKADKKPRKQARCSTKE